MFVLKTTLIMLNTLLFCFSLSLIQAKSSPEVESTVDDRKIDKESLLDNDEGSAEIDVFEKEANSFAAGKIDIDPPIEDDNIEGHYMSADVPKEDVDTTDDEEIKKIITTEKVEDEVKTKNIIITEIEEDEESSPYFNVGKGEAGERNIDEGPAKEGEKGSDVGDGGEKYREEEKHIDQEKFRHALDLLAELRKDLDDMIASRKYDFLL